jgi:UDP-glucose 4-epimerase
VSRPDSVLVVGAAGFIGSALVQSLCDAGRTVYAVGRSETPGHQDGVTRIQGSIEDAGLLNDVLAQCTQIVYSASVTTPGTSAREPSLEVLGNLLPLARLLECAWDFPERHLVYLSSGGTVYGDNARCADELAPLQPRSYYGAGKVAAEALLHACAQSSNWTTTVLRPTNPYGPGQDVARAFAVVPTLFRRAIDGGAFQMWGDGSAVRDYLYIDDLVSAIVEILSISRPPPHSVYNISSGDTASIKELLERCERACGRPIRVEYQAARGVDVPHVSPTHASLMTATAWRPRVALPEGLERTWDWISHTMHGVRV